MSFQAYLDNIKRQTGKTPEDFLALAQDRGLLAPGAKPMQIVNWLKADYGLGRGHAMAIVNTFRHATQPTVTGDERINKLFYGGRAKWRPVYDGLTAALDELGPDVRTAATDSYISLLRGKGKFGIVQIGVRRLDIGIKLKDTAAGGRLEPAGSWNQMVTHRVLIFDTKPVDDEVLAWLSRAYDQADK